MPDKTLGWGFRQAQVEDARSRSHAILHVACKSLNKNNTHTVLFYQSRSSNRLIFVWKHVFDQPLVLIWEDCDTAEHLSQTQHTTAAACGWVEES